MKRFAVDQKKIKFDKVPLINQRQFQSFIINNLTEEILEISLQSSLREIYFQNSNLNVQFQNSIFHNEV
jgi:hypothetical protein